jgi:hypothetical protein
MTMARGYLEQDLSCADALLAGLNFVHLTTAEALDDESAGMDHCIGHGDDDDDLADPTIKFVSLRSGDGKFRYATATLSCGFGADGRYGWLVEAFSGPNNRKPERALQVAIEAYARTLPLTAECLEDYWRHLARDAAYWQTADLTWRPECAVVKARLMQGIELATEHGKFLLGLDAALALEVAIAPAQTQTEYWLAAIANGALDQPLLHSDNAQWRSQIARLKAAQQTHPAAAALAIAYASKLWEPRAELVAKRARELLAQSALGVNRAA